MTTHQLAEIARTMVEIYADLPPGHPFFTQFSFIDADQLPAFQAVVTRADANGIEALELLHQVRNTRCPWGRPDLQPYG